MDCYLDEVHLDADLELHQQLDLQVLVVLLALVKRHWLQQGFLQVLVHRLLVHQQKRWLLWQATQSVQLLF